MQRIHLYILATTLTLLSTLNLYANGGKSSAIKHLREAERKHHGRISIQLTEVSSGRVILSYKANDLMTPASVVKLISTGTFLRQKGAKYRFETKIYAMGQVKTDTLHGDLVLVGSGDPSLASRYESDSETRLKKSIAQALRTHGITSITGGILIDSTNLPLQGTHHSWLEEDTGNYYGAGVYGLNYRDNYIDLLVSDAGGGEVVIEPTDADLGLSYINELSTGGERNSCYLTGSDTLLRLSGFIPRRANSYNLRPAHPAPMRYAHQRLRRLLCEEEDIYIQQEGKVGNYPLQLDTLSLLGIHTSVPADSLAKITNYRSANLYAEALGRCLYNKLSNDLGLDKYWQNRLKLDRSVLTIVDGSGLSRDNSLTAGALSSILVDLLPKDSVENSPFLHSLPIMGKEGTVKTFMPGSPIEARLKSGSMRGVMCYAGYIKHQDKWYALVMLSNGFGSANVARNAFASFMNSYFLGKEPIIKRAVHKGKHKRKHSTKGKRTKGKKR